MFESVKGAFGGGRGGVVEISPKDVQALIEARAGILLLDVREQREISLGMIAGAQWLPLGEVEQKIESVMPDRAREIVTYCAAGVRSATAARILAKIGYASVRSMAGGFHAWSRARLPYVTPATLSAEQSERYSRQMLLDEVGVAGQRKLIEARVLVVGAGGLGCPAALYLAAAGLGKIGIIDDDRVELSNLHRQILHTTDRLGDGKAESAGRSLGALNEDVVVIPIEDRLTSRNAEEVLRHFDIVVDGSDNFPTRYLVNDACYLADKPNIYGSVFQFEGQVTVFHPSRGGPCYRCLFPEPPPPELAPNCEAAGVIGVLPGTIGVLQATEVLKLILGIGEPLLGRMLHYDALESRFRTVTLKNDPRCRLCGSERSIRELTDVDPSCGSAGR